MTWRDLAASVVGSLAWPASVVCLALIFRRQVLGLLEAPIKSMKLGPGGFELEQWDRATALVAESVASAAVVEPDERAAEAERLMALAASAPEAAIVESFALVERELRRIAADAGIASRGSKRAVELAEEAADGGSITEAIADGVRGLATLRDLAAMGWGERMTAGRAVEYVTMARAVLSALRATAGDG